MSNNSKCMALHACYVFGIATSKQKLTTGLEPHSICNLRDFQFDQ